MLGRRKLFVQLGSCVALSTAGCGTIFHSERIGRTHSNDIDWKIAALDGLGLMLFFVPGVIAFVVDFYTGAIYLPQTGSQALIGETPLRRIVVGKKQLTPDQLATVVSQQLDQPIMMSPEHTRVSRLDQLDQYAKQCETHRYDTHFGIPLNQFFAFG